MTHDVVVRPLRFWSVAFTCWLLHHCIHVQCFNSFYYVSLCIPRCWSALVYVPFSVFPLGFSAAAVHGFHKGSQVYSATRFCTHVRSWILELYYIWFPPQLIHQCSCRHLINTHHKALRMSLGSEQLCERLPQGSLKQTTTIKYVAYCRLA